MDKLIEAVRKFGSNQPDPTVRIARALDSRDWRAYYLALEDLETIGHRRVCQACLLRGDSLPRINRRILNFHVRIHLAGIYAIFVLWFRVQALRPAVDRLIAAAMVEGS
jgi:hypothetical protein